MFLDRVYASAGGGRRFYEQPEFTTESMMTIFEMIYQRLMRLFTKKGYVKDEVAVSVDDDLEANVPMPFQQFYFIASSRGIPAQSAPSDKSVYLKKSWQSCLITDLEPNTKVQKQETNAASSPKKFMDFLLGV